MSKQTLQHIAIVTLLSIVIFGTMFWVYSSYQRKKHLCEKIIGGSFYSISFTQNICVNGTEVRQLD